MSKIEWCDLTINPIVGCSKISAGCQNCYAEKMARRLKAMGIPKYQDVVDEKGWTNIIGFDDFAFSGLPKTVPKKVFVCSMGDLFHEGAPFFKIDDVMDQFKKYPIHTFIVLTKRPRELYNWADSTNGRSYDLLQTIENLWICVSISTQEDADRLIPILLQIPAKVRGISVEPMLERITLNYLHYDNTVEIDALNGTHGVIRPHRGRSEKLDWVICGAETGPGKRPMKNEWAIDLLRQCRSAGVPYFFKKDSNGQVPSKLNVRDFPKT